MNRNSYVSSLGIKESGLLAEDAASAVEHKVSGSKNINQRTCILYEGGEGTLYSVVAVRLQFTTAMNYEWNKRWSQLDH